MRASVLSAETWSTHFPGSHFERGFGRPGSNDFDILYLLQRIHRVATVIVAGVENEYGGRR